ncbi:hypothetical protein J2752_001962 [Halarchaeum rubridurum]|uniref:C2H2-type domain-containing protein n=1 Tax=Halarchaeum rubridurum TaxID=489911 RepID=A0A8T4GN64_9EURY|nr:hypothetical protein [Halarchaeum rubridurum]MBP1955050.1 hypothetical protein [Halarchaeum rubridurum]
MTLQYYYYEYQVTAVAVTLVKCPLCGYEFDEGEHRWKHFLNDHTADDVPSPRSTVSDEREEPA